VDVERWHEKPVEQLSPTVGRQVVHTATMSVARILLKRGAVVPRHAHENEQVANVLEGRMLFRTDEGDHVVGSGESIVFPADAPHEAEALEDSVVLDVFAPPREDWRRGDDAYLRR